jgi:hypothetical protein
MTSQRLVISIILGVILSFFSAFFFNMTVILNQIELYAGTDVLRSLALLDLSGTIAKGLRRGVIAGSLVVVIVIAIWIILSIFSQVDLMSLFTGNQLIETLGGIISAFIGVLIGGSIGGLISGPYEEF